MASLSGSSSTAPNSLSRSKIAVLTVTALAAAYCIYYAHTNVNAETTEASDPTATFPSRLRRRNAIHQRYRRRRRPTETSASPNRGAGDLDGARDTTDYDYNDAATTRDPRLVENDETEVADDTNYEESSFAPEPHVRPEQLSGVESEGSDRERMEPPSDAANHRNGQNLLQLLFRVSEDATRKSAYLHRGCLCNSCGMVPIRGTRYRCANCIDFDLCESCEAQGVHTRTHVFYKVKVPAQYMIPIQAQPVWYPGDPESCQRTIPKALMADLARATGFERQEIDAFWEQFTFIANTEWRDDPTDLCLAMDRQTFEHALVPSGGNKYSAPNLMYDRMFAFYDSNNDDLIGFSEFVHGLAFRKRKDKLKKVFEGFDVDGDGYVGRKDCLRIYRAYYIMYKQMHRDVLENQDDLVMNRTEASQLITTRLPLSSAFGRDRFPPPPDDLDVMFRGKTKDTSGDRIVVDERGIMDENHDQVFDLIGREEVIGTSFEREYYAANPPYSLIDRYWATFCLDPLSIEELTLGVFESLARDPNTRDLPYLRRRSRPRSQSGSTSVHSSDEDDSDRGYWPPSIVIAEDVERALGPGRPLERVTLGHDRRRVITEALKRRRRLVQQRRDNAFAKHMDERWERRQFYTDEEEGFSRPGDGNRSDAVKAGKDPQYEPVSPRSRSSSKVRFVDDDDLDTRSNPSSSSRVVPERWGGMQISDAERDVGSEVLYQVTQQAFNELLDDIFKKEEDMAVAVAASKSERDQKRHEFRNPVFEAWAVARGEKPWAGMAKDAGLRRMRYKTMSKKRELARRPDLDEIELEDVRQRPLDELLSVTGFTVEDADHNGVNENRSNDISTGPTIGHLHSFSSNDAAQAAPNDPQSGNHEPYRDPTLPQFRPNSDSDTKSSSSSSNTLPDSSEDDSARHHHESADPSKEVVGAAGAAAPSTNASPVTLPTAAKQPTQSRFIEHNTDADEPAAPLLGSSASATAIAGAVGVGGNGFTGLESNPPRVNPTSSSSSSSSTTTSALASASSPANATAEQSNGRVDAAKAAETAVAGTDSKAATSSSTLLSSLSSLSSASSSPPHSSAAPASAAAATAATTASTAMAVGGGELPFSERSEAQLLDLLRLRALDLRALEMEARGAVPGKLDYAEFAGVVGELEKGGKRTDYLGGWIEFCLP